MNDSRCRIGELAIVLGDNWNTGLIVKIERANDDREWPHDWDGPTWWVSCSAELVWEIIEEGRDHRAPEGPLPDSILFPIRGMRTTQCEGELYVDYA